MEDSKINKRFWKYVEISDNGCWYWKGCKSSKGYGRFGVGKKVVLAHRYALLGLNEKFESRIVCHTCDHPACCNPDHLYTGTRLDNVNDMIERNLDFGSTHRKLYSGEVWLIRKLHKRGLKYAKIAPMFKVHPCTIKEAVKNLNFLTKD